MYEDVADRFWEKVDVRGPDECWPWMAARHNDYGVFSDANRRAQRANRVSLEIALGRPILPGLQALHSCDNPPCVNPAHLWEGTGKDNIHDAISKGRDACFKVQTHCKRGHEMVDENLYVRPNGERRCRTCWLDGMARCRAARRQGD